MALNQLGQPFTNLIDLRTYLKHVSVLNTMGRTAYGDTQITTTHTVACYAFYGEVKRGLTDKTQATGYRWNVLLPASLTVGSNDQFQNIVTQAGDAVLTSGVIDEVFPYVSWRTGPVLQHAILRVN